MLRRQFTFFMPVMAAVLAAGTMLGSPASAEVKSLEIIAPAAPGGGWDQHARSVQQVLQNQKLVPNVQVVNIPGAGGTIGLAQFVTAKKRTPTLLVGGHAIRWHLGLRDVTGAVAAWRDHAPGVFPLPHPSWRNTGWLRRNPWFETDLLPDLRAAVRAELTRND